VGEDATGIAHLRAGYRFSGVVPGVPAELPITGQWAGQRDAELQREGLVSRVGNRWSLTLLTAFTPHHSRTADTRDPCAHEAGEVWASVIRPLASVLQPAGWVLVSGSCSSLQLSLPGLRLCSASCYPYRQLVQERTSVRTTRLSGRRGGCHAAPFLAARISPGLESPRGFQRAPARAVCSSFAALGVSPTAGERCCLCG
jgi:hypothetical protein